MKLYYYQNGERKGPATSVRVRDMARKGEITPDTILESEFGSKIPAGEVGRLISGLSLEKEFAEAKGIGAKPSAKPASQTAPKPAPPKAKPDPKESSQPKPTPPKPASKPSKPAPKPASKPEPPKFAPTPELAPSPELALSETPEISLIDSFGSSSAVSSRPAIKPEDLSAFLELPTESSVESALSEAPKLSSTSSRPALDPNDLSSFLDLPAESESPQLPGGLRVPEALRNSKPTPEPKPSSTPKPTPEPPKAKPQDPSPKPSKISLDRPDRDSKKEPPRQPNPPRQAPSQPQRPANPNRLPPLTLSDSANSQRPGTRLDPPVRPSASAGADGAKKEDSSNTGCFWIIGIVMLIAGMRMETPKLAIAGGVLLAIGFFKSFMSGISDPK